MAQPVAWHTLQYMHSADRRFSVLIAGGGVAALEAALCLRELAGDRVAIRLLSTQESFMVRPMTVLEPFAHSKAPAYPLGDIATDIGVELIGDALASVDTDRCVARTFADRELRYDALLVATGARLREPFEHVTTIDPNRMDELLHGLVQDVEEGYATRIGFVVPGHVGWPLPLYELALLTAGRAFEMSLEPEIVLITPEDRPLAIFGPHVSEVVEEQLGQAGVQVVTRVYARVPHAGTVVLRPGYRRRQFDRIVALPELDGPAIEGLPSVERGFIPVDTSGAVHGVQRVFAAGDVTDFPIKHGSIAAEQADAAAQSIAALAGASVDPEPFDPEIDAMLLTDSEPLYLRARIAGGRGASSVVSRQPPTHPPAKIAAMHLSPYLAGLDSAGLAR